MKKLSLYILTVILVVLTALSGCGKNEKTAQGGSAKEVDQTITANLGGEPYTLDPAFASDTTSYWVIDHLYEGLYSYDKNGKVVKGTASKVDVSEDGKTYTFTIRDDAKWSNGDAVTANDFEYSWKRVLNPKTAAYDPSSFYYIKGAEEYNTGKGSVDDVAIKAEDEKTLVVQLDTPIKFFPTVLQGHGFLPVNQQVVEADEKWAAEAEGIVSNGAYVVSAWKHNDEITLDKNKEHWNTKNIGLDSIKFKMIADATTEYQMFKSKELDLVKSIPSEAIDQEKSSDEYISSPSFSVYTYSFNVNEKPFTNKKIRQAFAYAIDRDAITKNVSKGGEKAAYGYVAYGAEAPSGKDFRDEVSDYYSFDADKAKKLLKEGLKEEGWSTLPEVTLKYNSEANHKKIAEALQEMFKENLGVETVLENQEWKTYIDSFKQKNFQIARMGWVGDFLDPYPVLNLYSTKSSSNFTNWSNTKYDKLLSDSLVEQDEAKRYELLHQAEELLMTEMPIIPIYFSSQNALVSKKVEGIRFDALTSPDLRFAKVTE
ncbi:peptide ABC transporter substrate-binding protein [Peribacillus psychrosaccharolyticus]|uniref:Peptide ABC transporter substrate-binding protein n=1 Tax=Peribacillus psychrosaccharolyticus TaxID=1407 RepID=A0A974S129_PERPY|nr:peptide ABC transporter substrate-binding protein [Peribacillus psychrosaccharolyticus]MEC2054437.1 peptide ABC transporter substrate-binding protein [Peribacillus psychrosaccharolyticus]MED3744336.1 peptide ABC transporter substrate-binding protein [Peribacillus psychrosaccharolyticus]QQS99814.1 peptide ABC transporter substrate-binding protein [Peribacillus psychrosaccharolyticus]